MRDRNALVVVIHPRLVLAAFGNLTMLVLGMVGLWVFLLLATI